MAQPYADLAEVVERHHNSGRTAVGFVHGAGLSRGALASSVAHDAHNIIAIGIVDDDLRRAIARVAEIGGGLVVNTGDITAKCPLPVAGLLSDAPLEDVIAKSNQCNTAAKLLGWRGESPFMTLSFLALSVIPALKITDQGLVDVERAPSCLFTSAEQQRRRGAMRLATSRAWRVPGNQSGGRPSATAIRSARSPLTVFLSARRLLSPVGGLYDRPV